MRENLALAQNSSLYVSVQRADLVTAVNRVRGVVERKTTIPVLQNVLLETVEEGLRLTATDLELFAVATIPAVVHQPGSLTVDADTLNSIVRGFSPDVHEIEIFLNDAQSQVMIKSGRSKFNLTCLDASEFPRGGVEALPFHFTIEAADLALLIKRTSFAMSSEETRYFLNGIYMHLVEHQDQSKGLCFVATDGHRLARMEVPFNANNQQIPGVILSRKTVRELQHIVSDEKNKKTLINVSLSETQVCFAVGTVELSAKLIDAVYPDYTQAIPESSNKKAILNIEEFKNAIIRAGIMTDDKNPFIKLSFSTNSLQVTSSSLERGSAEESLEVEYTHPENLTIGFNQIYLKDVAAEIQEEAGQVECLLSDAISPMIVQPVDHQRLLYVIMPMRG